MMASWCDVTSSMWSNVSSTTSDASTSDLFVQWERLDFLDKTLFAVNFLTGLFCIGKSLEINFILDIIR